MGPRYYINERGCSGGAAAAAANTAHAITPNVTNMDFLQLPAKPAPHNGPAITSHNGIGMPLIARIHFANYDYSKLSSSYHDQ